MVHRNLLHIILHGIATYTGSNDTTGIYYGFWSGFGGDLLEVGIIGFIYRKFICHVQGCFRIGHHSFRSTGYLYCTKHYKQMLKDKIAANAKVIVEDNASQS